MLSPSRSILFAVVIASSACFGCVGGSKSNPAQKDSLKPYVLAQAPSDIPNRLDTDFDGKVKLLGYKLTPSDKVAPGTEIRLTMYWQSKEKLDDGWYLFTHLLDSAGERVLNIDNVGPLREINDNKQALPPGSWEKGKVYVDEQVFTLPDNITTPEITFSTGIWKGADRLKVVSGAHDNENRAIVAHLKTAVEPSSPKPATSELKSLQIERLAKDDKITIDGKLDEAAWKKAASTGALVDVGNGNPNPEFPVQGSTKITWDDKNLYVAFEVQSKTVVGGWEKTAKDPHLWEKDTVEIMLDPDGDGDNNDYYEIQINPQNLVFDTQYDTYNAPKDDAKGSFGHMDWSAKLKSAVVVDGTMDKDGEAKGYVVEAAIPWASFSKAKSAPPKSGDSWRVNFYAMKNNSGVAWSPILGQGNFHKASRFGRITWVVPGEAAPAASASASASPALSLNKALIESSPEYLRRKAAKEAAEKAAEKK